jgi:hypothetical protein
MNYANSSQRRTFKIVEENHFSDEDLLWIRSLIHVSLVTVHKKTIRVFIETEDALTGIVNSIDKKYCNSSKPKLSPLFCVLQQS